MAHVLICGMTESGKTTLARNLAAYYRSIGYGVLVLDPLSDPRWQCDFITADAEEFLDVFWSSRRCMAFMDEGGESVGRYDTAMQKTATRGRHWGHSCHYISQEPTQMAPIVRAQCSHLFAFCMSQRQSKMLAEEFNKPELLKCGELKQGEYIHAVKFGRTVINTGVKNDVTNSDRRGSRARNSGSSGEPEEDAPGEVGTPGTARDATGTATGPGDTAEG